MGTSTNAVLAYGYNLGGSEDWKVREVGEWGELKLSWYTEFDLDEEDNEDNEDSDEGEDDGDEDDGFPEQAMKRLLAAAGLEGPESGDEYWERHEAAQKQVGVEVDLYCMPDYPMYTLATKVITVRRGDCEELDFEVLNREAVEGAWDEKLAAALKVLEITPTQERPRWLLCSYWSG